MAFRNMISRIHLIAVVPLVLSLTAFILSMLCIFAGSKKGYLESADLFTFNTSMLGQTTLSTPKTTSSVVNSVGKDINKGINKAIGNVAKQVNIHDFYSAYILDHCEGYFTPSAISNSTSHPTKNITSCSKSSAFAHFDPTAIIQKELKHGVNMTDLQWPSAIQDAIRVVEFSSKAMFLFYAMGAAAAGLALIGALLRMISAGRLIAIVNVTISGLAVFCLMIASAIATAIINRVVDAVNIYGNEVGVLAYRGTTFIGMTWAATLLVLLSGVVWAFEFFRDRQERFAYGMEDKLYER